MLVKISAAGFAKGARSPSGFSDQRSAPTDQALTVAHRVCGGTVDIATGGPAAGKRALGKLKATSVSISVVKL